VDRQLTTALPYLVTERPPCRSPTNSSAATLAPDERIHVTREHSFRQITTRRYYPGQHAISLQINGVESPRADFELAAPDTP